MDIVDQKKSSNLLDSVMNVTSSENVDRSVSEAFPVTVMTLENLQSHCRRLSEVDTVSPNIKALT